jgi:hypothetical protein
MLIHALSASSIKPILSFYSWCLCHQLCPSCCYFLFLPLKSITGRQWRTIVARLPAHRRGGRTGNLSSCSITSIACYATQSFLLTNCCFCFFFIVLMRLIYFSSCLLLFLCFLLSARCQIFKYHLVAASALYSAPMLSAASASHLTLSILA